MSAEKPRFSEPSNSKSKRVAAALVVSIFVYPVVITITAFTIQLLQKFVTELSLAKFLSGLAAPFSGFGATMLLGVLILFLIFPTPGVAAYFAFRTFRYHWIGWMEVALVALMLGLVSWVPLSWFEYYYEGLQTSYSWQNVWLQTWRNTPVALASVFAALCCWKILRLAGALQQTVNGAADTEPTS